MFEERGHVRRHARGRYRTRRADDVVRSRGVHRWWFVSIGRGCIGTRVVGLGACARENDETTRLTVFLCCIRFLAVTHDGGALPGTRASRPRRRVDGAPRRRFFSTDADLPFLSALPPRTSPRRRSACKRDGFSTRSVIYTRARRVERISASTRARPRPASTRARPCPDGCASATTRSTPSSENLS